VNNPQIQRFEQRLARDMRHIERRPLSNQQKQAISMMKE
jgi:hypothetical protein